MLKFLNSEIFWLAASVIIAGIAVVNKFRKPKRELIVGELFIQKSNKGILELVVTVENTGGIPVIITECGFGMISKGGIFVYLRHLNINITNFIKKNIKNIDSSLNNYMINTSLPLKVKAGEAKLIVYRYNHGTPFNFDDNNISRTKEYEYFSNRIIFIRDSRNNHYPSIEKRFVKEY